MIEHAKHQAFHGVGMRVIVLESKVGHSTMYNQAMIEVTQAAVIVGDCAQAVIMHGNTCISHTYVPVYVLVPDTS